MNHTFRWHRSLLKIERGRSIGHKFTQPKVNFVLFMIDDSISVCMCNTIKIWYWEPRVHDTIFDTLCGPRNEERNPTAMFQCAPVMRVQPYSQGSTNLRLRFWDNPGTGWQGAPPALPCLWLTMAWPGWHTMCRTRTANRSGNTAALPMPRFVALQHNRWFCWSINLYTRCSELQREPLFKSAQVFDSGANSCKHNLEQEICT